MTVEYEFTPTIVDEPTQVTQIAHLKKWTELVRKRDPDDVVCLGITKFLEYDLLRYGNWPMNVGVKRGFGVVCQSAAVTSFLDEQILPRNKTAWIVLDMLHDGKALMDTAFSDGKPEFVFCGGLRELAIAKN